MTNCTIGAKIRWKRVKRTARGLVRRSLKHAGLEVRRIRASGASQERPYTFIEGVLHTLYTRRRSTLNVVQIGAADGYTNDPLERFLKAHDDLRALLVEPQLSLAAKSRTRWKGDDRVKVCQVAVSKNLGTIRLFSLAEDLQADYVALGGKSGFGITSTDLWHVVSKVADRFSLSAREAEALVEEQEVESVPLNLLCERHSIGFVDVLVTDVEGMDDEVVMQIDALEGYPSVVIFEAVHLKPEQWAQLEAFLVERGYRLYEYGQDCVGMLSGAPES